MSAASKCKFNPILSSWVLTSRGHERLVNESHLHNNAIVNQSFSSQRMEENSSSVDQDSNKPASGNPMQGLTGFETVGERNKSSSLHCEAIAFSILMVKPACSRETAGCWNDTDHVSTHSGRESNRRGRNVQFFTKREIPMKDRVWTILRGFPRNDRHFRGNSHLERSHAHGSTSWTQYSRR